MRASQLHADMSFWTAGECAFAYGEGIASPLEVTRHRLRAAQDSKSVFIALTEEMALRQASASEERWRKKAPRSGLDGVPVAWKDLFDIEATVTTAGSLFFDVPAKRSAALVEVAAQAGMVTIGKTNLSEFAYSGLGLNPHYGTPTNNEWPGQYAPGGSSSGSAIAVANHLVPLAIGTDTGGSVRIPAAFNGIVGFRASRNRYSKVGMMPLAASLDTIGPMARSVRDCFLFDQAVHFSSMTHPVSMVRSISVPKEIIDNAAIESEVLRCFWRSLETLKQAGYQVHVRSVQALQDAMEVMDRLGWFGASEAYAAHRERLQGSRAHLFDPRVRQRLLNARDTPAWCYIDSLKAREELMRSLQEELGGGLLAMPTVVHVAPKLELLQDDSYFAKKNLETLRLTMIGSFLDMPAVAMPSGRAESGQFCGIQFSVASGGDETLLATCQEIERANEAAGNENIDL